MTQVYTLALVGAVVAVALIMELLRRRQLTEKYAAIWLILGIAIMVLAVWPRSLGIAAELVGIEVPSNLLFFASAFVLLIVCLQLSRETSRLEGRRARWRRSTESMSSGSARTDRVSTPSASLWSEALAS